MVINPLLFDLILEKVLNDMDTPQAQKCNVQTILRIKAMTEKALIRKKS